MSTYALLSRVKATNKEISYAMLCYAMPYMHAYIYMHACKTTIKEMLRL